MRIGMTCLIVALLVGANTGAADASLLIYGTHTSYDIIPGGSLDDVVMMVEMLVVGGQATFTFTNVSTGLESTAVFKEIVIDTTDDDTALEILTNGQVQTPTDDVAYQLVESDGLPGYQDETLGLVAMQELQADSPPTIKGIGPGESLEVVFTTTLSDGSDIDDYVAAFNGGSDTGKYSIGFHAINASTVDGESLSGILIPEPGVVALIAFGAVPIVWRKFSQNRKSA